MVTFIDAYSGYNQIPMHLDDDEKTSFIMEKGTSYYRVMPFSLKNAGATYQRLINKLSHKQIGVTIKVYISNILVKSYAQSVHVSHLKETFKVLRKSQLKLNPMKCVYGNRAGKFLCFMVS